MRLRTLAAGVLLLTLAAAVLAAPEDVRPNAGMLRYPAVSATQIAFVYAGRLWLVPRAGGVATPLAEPPSSVVFPRFSPDGKTIAYCANYDGNRDIYTIPVEGGVPVRVTHHPTGEMLCGWAPGGKLLFAASGVSGIGRMSQLYTVPSTGGMPQMLPVPYGADADISADGRWLAYVPYTTDFRTWKRYRGGMATDVWLFDLQQKKGKRITDWEGTDTLPMWHDASVYYVSDGGPEHRLNIWRYETKSGKRAQITRYTDYDIKFPSMGPGAKGEGEIVYQYGASLCLLDLATGAARTVDVRVPGDRQTIRAHSVDASRFIAGWSLSPSGKRVAVEARGDIWSVPAKEGSSRDLTRTSGSAERDPAWSPDGRWIAYLSDATGEYEIYVTRADGKGETRQVTKDGKCFRYTGTWSPDSKYLTFSDKTGALYLCTVATGQTRLVDTEPWAGPLTARWSHDSRWMAYAKTGSKSRTSAVWLYNVETGEAKQVTSGVFDDGGPVFDRKGDYLYFVSSRSFNPTSDSLMGTWIYANTNVLLAAPLRADIASPYNAKSDEEPAPDAAKAPDKKAEVAESAGPAAAQADEVSGTWAGAVTGPELPDGKVSFTATLKLDAANNVTGTIEASVGAGSVTGTYNPQTKELTISVNVGAAGNVTIVARIAGGVMTGTASAMGQTFALRAERAGGGPAAPTKPDARAEAKPEVVKPPAKLTIDLDGLEARAIQLPVRAGQFGQLSVNDRNQLIYARSGVMGSDSGIKLFDITDEKKEEKAVAAGADGFELSADGKKLLLIRGGGASIQDASAGAAGEAVVTSGMAVTIEPRAEWRQLLREAWRIERDFFYDPNMHGLKWQKVYDSYAAMLPDCASRDDVGYVISEMISEMNVGHAYYGGGDVPSSPSVSVGMAGADFALENGAYRISHIYQGAPWDSDARGPLSQPGVKVKEGDYLLAVNGVPVDPKLDPWAALQGLADRIVTLTVSARPTIDKDARDVPIRLLGSDGNLRYRAWIERNRAYVDRKTEGRVGYIYVPDTGTGGQNDLVRQFHGQRGKDALIIDERWNGGGQIPDRFIELLNRPVTNYWARRDGNDWPWPQYAHFGPKCMLINGLAGSGGDCFPWMFRQSKLGKLIGTRTWGGLVGISGNPGLIDGAMVTAPTFAFYKPDGTWGVEGHGVDPDIEVLDDPTLMADGGDPQLDAGIAEMLTELKQHAYVAPKRPAYPNRSGMGIPPRDR